MAIILAGCSHPTTPAVEQLPRPSTGFPSIVPGQEPLVWVSGQSVAVSPSRITIVENGGSKAVVHRLAEGTTRFFVLHGGRFESMPEADARHARPGTPICVESLLDGRRLVALKVFFGAACGPRTSAAA
ncbi:MAG TPA: hypothetical protein VID47_10915 [Actinomycetota bacterium]